MFVVIKEVGLLNFYEAPISLSYSPISPKSMVVVCVVAWFPVQDWTPLLPQLEPDCGVKQTWARAVNIQSCMPWSTAEQLETINYIISISLFFNL